MSLSRYDPAGLDVASTTPMIIEYASVTTISIIATSFKYSYISCWRATNVVGMTHIHCLY